MKNLYAKNFDDADEVKNPPKAKAQIVKLGNVNASKIVLEPGWRWSECIKPTVGGDSCQAGHVGVVILGRMKCIHDFEANLRLVLVMLIILLRDMMVGSLEMNFVKYMSLSKLEKILDLGNMQTNLIFF